MFKNILPWKKKEVKKTNQGRDLFHDLHQQMDSLFDNFFNDFDSGFKFPSLNTRDNGWFKTPEIDVSENKKEIKIEANCPGLEEKEIDVHLDGDSLIIKGEKCIDSENKDNKYYVSERRCGSFQRVIPVNNELVDHEKIKASLKKGVLKITLPKIPGKESDAKKIQISTE